MSCTVVRTTSPRCFCTKAWSIWMTSPKGLVGLVAELPATVGVTVLSDMVANRVRVIG